MTEPQEDMPVVSGQMSANDVTNLLRFVMDRLNALENRLLTRLTDNSNAATERWREHEREHARWCDEVSRIERKLDEHIGDYLADKDRERRVEVQREAYLTPARRTADLVLHHWKDIAIFVLFALTVLGLTSEPLRLP